MDIFKVRPLVSTKSSEEIAAVFSDVLNKYEEEVREAMLDCVLFGHGEALLRLEEKVRARVQQPLDAPAHPVAHSRPAAEQ